MLTLKQTKTLFTASLFTLLSIIKINAQTFSYSLQSTALSFDYSSVSNFTSARTIPKAFTLSINNSSRGRYNVYCKIIANSSQIITTIPTSLFSIKLNSANFTVSSSFYQQINIGLTDVLVGNASSRSGKSDLLYYDLILNPLGYTFEPTLYNYSFVFTVSEY